jgi:hypothetical protein
MKSNWIEEVDWWWVGFVATVVVFSMVSTCQNAVDRHYDLEKIKIQQTTTNAAPKP